MQEQNGYLILAHLSDIELYYTPPEFVEDKKIILSGTEFHHAVNVMRNSPGEIIHITDGAGFFFKAVITEISRSKLIADIIESNQFQNKASNLIFCVPVLKNSDRLKFAIEKCVELGVTNFILFTSKHTIPKKVNSEKLKSTAVSAMKQSLQTFLPVITVSSFDEIINLDGTKVIFDQHSAKIFTGKVNSDKPVYLLFGPEGGFEKSELKLVKDENKFYLSPNRLRSETAIIQCASLLISL